MGQVDKEDAYIGIDPGDTTGVAIVDKEGKIHDTDQVAKEDIEAYLMAIPLVYNVKLVVVEEYIVYGHKAQGHRGSKLTASQVIGIVKMWAFYNKIPVVMQMASILPIAEKWSGKSMKGTAHSSTHWLSAYLHIFYYLHKRGLAKSRLQKEMDNGEIKESKN